MLFCPKCYRILTDNYCPDCGNVEAEYFNPAAAILVFIGILGMVILAILVLIN